MSESARPRRVAVVGAGWAGLAAAVRATQAGDQVTLIEMAGMAGGRARRAGELAEGLALDNGQHILIGAYASTLALMRAVGIDPDHVLMRLPLRLVSAGGRGLALPAGRPLTAFVRAMLAASHWSAGERLRLLAAAGGWLARGFRCPPDWTVARLTRSLGSQVRRELIDPLCVAALNTPAGRASAAVFLRVLRDALFSAPGASDLLLPRVDLGRLLPDAACDWLARQGAELRWRHRAQQLDAQPDGGWAIDGEAFDRVVLAASATESARLAAPHAPDWAATAGAMAYEPIVTVVLRMAGGRLPFPMLALDASDTAPAQFVFDLGALRSGEPGAEGVLAFVVSGASAWVQAGTDATVAAVIDQARRELAPLAGGKDRPEPQLVRHLAERRATFACTPGLRRSPMQIAPGLRAAGDHVEGPYPATLEGAVRSGLAAADR
jgi:squalene-associated FAD-dependent desaturase